MSPDTSAQDEPVASQEAEARYIVRFREDDPWPCCELVDTVTGSVIADDGGAPEDRNLYRDFAPLVAELNRVARLLASERERYAALVGGLVQGIEQNTPHEIRCVVCGGWSALYGDSPYPPQYRASSYVAHREVCSWVEASIALAALEEAESA